MWKEFTEPIATTLRLGNAAPLEEKLQRWRAIGNFVSNLTDPGIESQTFRSRVEHVTARLSDQSRHSLFDNCWFQGGKNLKLRMIFSFINHCVLF